MSSTKTFDDELRGILDRYGHIFETGYGIEQMPEMVAAIRELVEQVIGEDEPAKLYGKQTELQIEQRLARNDLRAEQRTRLKGDERV